MSDHAVQPVHVNGVTTAINATVATGSGAIAITSTTIIVANGAQPIHIRFGKELDTVTTSNGLWLPANTLLRLSVPGGGATHLHHIRAGGTDSTISVQPCFGGV